jgi:CubicO group peptidase (beta-lactamase class C family)
MRKPLLSAMLLSLMVLGLLSLMPVAPDPGEGIVLGRIGKKIDKYLSRITPFGFSGAILAVKEGNIVLNKGYGLAVRAKNIPNTRDTVFSTGSITKQFTAAGIMKLEMMGRLNTSDPITKFFKKVPPDKGSISLHHLLTHTAGVADMVGGDYEKAGRDETVRKILARPLQFKPGEEFSYSNGGYSILAAVVEIVSGESYEDFLFKNLFEPAGMLFTGYRRPDWSAKTVAHWYVGKKDNGTPLEKPYPYWNLLGNGGILSTTEDMYRWHLALMDNRVLSPEAKAKMYTPVLNEYGYGWDIIDSPRGRLIQHDGGSMLGSSAEFRRYIDADIVTMLFCNQSFEGRALFDAVRDRIETLAFDGDVALPPAVLPVEERRTAKDMAGAYDLESGGSISIQMEEERLVVCGEDRRSQALLMGANYGELDALERLNTLSETIFAAVLEGDFSPFNSVLARRERREGPVRRLIEDRLDLYLPRTGPITKVQTVRTVPVTMDGRGAAESVVELKGEKGSIYFGLLWDGEKNIGLMPMMSPQSISIPFLPVSELEFCGYHLAAGHVLTLDFVRKKGRIVGLLLSSDGEEINAGKKNGH